jgi:hypothetical protein
MKIKRPLSNPLLATQINKDTNEPLVLSDEFKSSAFQKQLDKTIIKFQEFKQDLGSSYFSMYFWYNFQFILRIISFLAIVYTAISQWNNINPQIPFIYDHIENSWSTVTKEIFFLIIFLGYICWGLIDYLLRKNSLSNKKHLNLYSLIISAVTTISIIGILQIILLSTL